MTNFKPDERQRQYWITTLSNFLYDHLDNGCILRHSLAKGCRCGSCREFQIFDPDTKEIVASAECLEDFIKERPATKATTLSDERERSATNDAATKADETPEKGK